MGSSQNLPVLARLECPECGHRTFHPIREPVPPCPECGNEQQVLDTFRDRRRVDAPVKDDRRGER